jgi:hypothetical protein
MKTMIELKKELRDPLFGNDAAKKAYAVAVAAITKSDVHAALARAEGGAWNDEWKISIDAFKDAIIAVEDFQKANMTIT